LLRNFEIVRTNENRRGGSRCGVQLFHQQAAGVSEEMIFERGKTFWKKFSPVPPFKNFRTMGFL
jgi:hypothetical protein